MYHYYKPEYMFDDMYYEASSDELWARILEAPDYYINNYGDVWSDKTKHFLKPKKMDREGHLGFAFQTDNGIKYLYLHRLIAEYFIPNPENFPIVRHLDDIKDNNELENLAWGTPKDNHLDCARNGNYKCFTNEMREIAFKKLRKPIVAFNINDGTEIIFQGQNEAARILGLQQSNIFKVLKKERKSTCGWTFKYLDGGDSDEQDY